MVLLRRRWGQDRYRLGDGGIELEPHRVDPLQAGAFELLAEFLVDHLDTLADDQGRPRQVGCRQPIEIIEHVEKLHHEARLGPIDKFNPFSGNPLAKIVEIGRQPKIPIVRFRQLIGQPVDGTFGQLGGGRSTPVLDERSIFFELMGVSHMAFMLVSGSGESVPFILGISRIAPLRQRAVGVSHDGKGLNTGGSPPEAVEGKLSRPAPDIGPGSRKPYPLGVDLAPD